MPMARNDQANDIFEQTSFLYGGNADYIDELYASYKANPASVNAEWQCSLVRSTTMQTM